MRSIRQKILGKYYDLLIARTLQQKKKGMNIFKNSPKRTGMLFPYQDEIKNRSFTLSQTPFNLLVIFLDKNNNVVYQDIGRKNQIHPIICKKPSMTVIEIPIG